MRTLIQLALITLMLGTAVLTNPAVADELRTGHLLPLAAGVNSLQRAQSVGVLYSENTRDNLSYLERYHAMAVNGAKDALDGRIREAFVNSSDPELAIDWLMNSLQGTFVSVRVYGSLDALVQAHPDVVVVLDTHNQLLTQRNDVVEARFTARFYDSDLQYIAKAEGSVNKQVPSVWVHDKSAFEIAAQIEQQRDVQQDALKQFDASLKALVRAG
ncbi:ATPase [Pseudomonas fluorescens]|uniref:ATPase n=1 Tax=Pseudomonas fluorescens TaxID=294 RepID=UPI00177FF72C|nr:ATPase [Pseudomonas fluorescens]MBD8151235.1 ATPase [Pseudomonas fluorescens]MBD8179234.1 ATPase [Pseudomonas fluorescens]MBD8746517.1 ATPase [Pseudomonas fluorescens]MBD8749718.1 ATPase [Pseudomonas fluorescens]MBD8758775.1 ATPase [Pseudomonas fluorescens]